MPQKRGDLSGSASDSLVIDRPEVLLATIACGATRGDLLVQVELPVHALGDGLDDRGRIPAAASRCSS